MNKNWLFAMMMMLAAWGSTHAASDSDQLVKPVLFAKGSSQATIKDSIKGYNYIDYQLRAAAGQTISVTLIGSNEANYFNLLPPDVKDVAMARGELTSNKFIGLLPDDGLYTIRVYLMRSAARRNETSKFTLAIGVTGKPMAALPAASDALVPGTRFHAQSKIMCNPPYTQARECKAGVIRRGHDGSATVEISWDNNQKRRILFLLGKPVAADVAQRMTFKKNDRDDLVVSFEGDERYEIPEVLIMGG